MAPNTGRGSRRRGEYLDLRRDGKTHEDACRELGIAFFDRSARRYAHWWEAEGGEPEPARKPLALSPFDPYTLGPMR